MILFFLNRPHSNSPKNPPNWIIIIITIASVIACNMPRYLQIPFESMSSIWALFWQWKIVGIFSQYSDRRTHWSTKDFEEMADCEFNRFLHLNQKIMATVFRGDKGFIWVINYSWRVLGNVDQLETCDPNLTTRHDNLSSNMMLLFKI